MASYVEIKTGAQLQSLVDGTKLTIVIFYKGARDVLNTIGMIPARLADRVVLARCDLNANPWAETQYQITADPTFVAFAAGKLIRRMAGMSELIAALPELAKSLKPTAGAAAAAGAAAGPSGSGSGDVWMGATIAAKNYGNITASVEQQGLDILNANTALAGPRVLFDGSKPSGKAGDGVESDTDEQLMLFIPFQAAVKLHSIHITSLVDEDDDDDEAPSRPRTVKIFVNTHHILGFDDGEEREATQMVELKGPEWNKDGTAVITTKFVKFQNVSALTLFFVDVQRQGGEKVRIDRIRVVGEVMGEKVDMAKLKQEQE